MALEALWRSLRHCRNLEAVSTVNASIELLEGFWSALGLSWPHLGRSWSHYCEYPRRHAAWHRRPRFEACSGTSRYALLEASRLAS